MGKRYPRIINCLIFKANKMNKSDYEMIDREYFAGKLAGQAAVRHEESARRQKAIDHLLCGFGSSRESERSSSSLSSPKIVPYHGTLVPENEISSIYKRGYDAGRMSSGNIF